MSGSPQVPLLTELQAHAASSDATQSVSVEPTGILRISGVASGDSIAELNFGKYSLMVPLVMDMGPGQTLKAFEQAMPSVYMLRVVHEQSGILQVVLLKRGQQAAEVPKLQAVPAPSPVVAPPLSLSVPMRVMAAVSSSDPSQHIVVEASGLIRISGVSTSAGLSPSSLRISLEARLIDLELPRGSTPKDSFERVRAEVTRRLPAGTRVLLVNQGEGPEGDVVFDVLKPAPAPPRSWSE